MSRKLKVKNNAKLCPHCHEPILIDLSNKTVRLRKETIKKLVDATKNLLGTQNGEMIDARIQLLIETFEKYQRHNCEQFVAQLSVPNVTIVIKGEKPLKEEKYWLKP